MIPMDDEIVIILIDMPGQRDDGQMNFINVPRSANLGFDRFSEYHQSIWTIYFYYSWIYICQCVWIVLLNGDDQTTRLIIIM